MWLIHLCLNSIFITKILQLLRSNKNRKYPIDAKGRNIISLEILFCIYDYLLLTAVISFLLCDTEKYLLEFNVIFPFLLVV